MELCDTVIGKVTRKQYYFSMPHSLLLLALSSTIVTAGFVGFVIFLFSFKKSSRFHSRSLRNWGLGFFLLTWIRIPTTLVLAGIPISSTVEGMAPFFIVASIALVAGHMLIFRGTVQLLTTSKFWINIFPLLIFVLLNALISGLFLVFHTSVTISLYFTTGFIFLNVLFLIIANIKLLRSAMTQKEKIGFWSLIVGWIAFFVSHNYLTQVLSNYPIDFWFFALTAAPTVYIYAGFTVAHLLLLFGFILSHTHDGLIRREALKSLRE